MNMPEFRSESGPGAAVFGLWALLFVVGAVALGWFAVRGADWAQGALGGLGLAGLLGLLGLVGARRALRAEGASMLRAVFGGMLLRLLLAGAGTAAVLGTGCLDETGFLVALFGGVLLGQAIEIGALARGARRAPAIASTGGATDAA